MREALRFLRVVDATPPWMLVLTLVIGAYAIALVWTDPGSADDGLGMLLLWQMLAASRGFVGPASSGHFDPLLVRRRRGTIAAAHAFHSTAGVMGVWMGIGVLELARGTSHPLAFEPGRAAALIFVSLTAWAISLRAPRLIAGALWLALIVMMATTRFGMTQYASAVASPENLLHAVQAGLVAIVCPFVMLDPVLPGRDVLSTVLAGGAVGAAVAGTMFIVRRNYTLERTS